MDWRKIEQILAGAARQQGFNVTKDGNGRFVVLELRYGGNSLDLEHLAREVADRIRP